MLTHTDGNYDSLVADLSAIAKSGTTNDREAVRQYLVDVLNATKDRSLKISILSLINDIPTFGYPVLGPQYLRATVFRHYIDDTDRIIRDRCYFPLFFLAAASPSEIAELSNTIVRGRWEALPLAIRWGITNLEGAVRVALPSLSDLADNRQHLAAFYPHRFDQYTAAQKVGMNLEHRISMNERVAVIDAARAYLAWVGDKEQLDYLVERFETAPIPTDLRRSEHKDKMYWYVLLLVAGKPPSEVPTVPIH